MRRYVTGEGGGVQDTIMFIIPPRNLKAHVKFLWVRIHPGFSALSVGTSNSLRTLPDELSSFPA